MQLNRAYSAPAISRQNSSTSSIHTKKIFGIQAGPGRSRVNAEHEMEYVQTLKESTAALTIVDNHIKKALKLVQTFNEFVATVKRMEQQRELKRQQKQAQVDAANNSTSLWRQSLSTAPEHQENHVKLCALLLAQYKSKLDEMFATGHMKKLWEIPGSHSSTIPKAYRDTVSYRPNKGGRGEPSLDFGVFTDISEELRRRIERWDKLNLPAFDTSGPRLPKLILSAAANVDTVGMQIRQMKKWWGHRGVKFNDIDRDTMAFAKAVAPQGAPRYYTKKSTLDEIHEYRFPFKCTGERFGMDDLSEEEIIMLGDSGGGASLAAARRRKGNTTKKAGLKYEEPTAKHISSLGVTVSDPIDDDDLGLPTDYLKRLEPYERHNTMKSAALKARLKGQSVSFLSKVKRNEPPVYLKKEIFPNVPIGLTPKKFGSGHSQQMFGKGPSGRERPGIPFVRTSARKTSRIPIPMNMEEYHRMKQGLPLRKRKKKNSHSNIHSNIHSNSNSMTNVTSGGSALLTNGTMGQGGSALMEGSMVNGSVTSKGPSMPSRVPGDSMVSGSAGPAEDEDEENESMMFGDDDMDDNGEDEMYAAMAAEADVDAHVSFEETSLVNIDELAASSSKMSKKSKRSKSKSGYNSSASTLPPGESRTMSSTSGSVMLGQSSSSSSSKRKRRHVGMQITVRSPAGAYVSLRVTLDTTIGELRELVRTKSGLSSKIRQQLESCAVIVFKKHVVSPDSTLREAGVSNGSTLQALQYW